MKFIKCILILILLSSCKEHKMNSVSSLLKTNNKITNDKSINSSYSQIPINCDGEKFAPKNCGNKEKNFFFKFSIVNNKSVIEFKYKHKIFNHSLTEPISELGINSFLFENESKMILIIDSFLEYGHSFYVYQITDNEIKFISTANFNSKFDNNEIELKYKFNISENDNSVIIKLGNGYGDIKLSNISNFYNLPSKNIITEQLEQTYPSYLKGFWRTGCENKFTVLDINNTEGYLSLNSVNAVFINMKVERLSKENEYVLKYAGISSQQNYYEEELKLNEAEISKDKVIGNIVIQKDGKALLNWIGLYNMKKEKLEFVGKDFSLIRESGGKNPVLLEKCD